MLNLKTSPRATRNSLSLGFRSETIDRVHLPCHTVILGMWGGEISQKRENSGNGDLREVVLLLILFLSVLVSSMSLHTTTKQKCNYYSPPLDLVIVMWAELSSAPGRGFLVNSTNRPQNTVSPIAGENHCVLKTWSHWSIFGSWTVSLINFGEIYASKHNPISTINKPLPIQVEYFPFYGLLGDGRHPPTWFEL